MNKNRALLLDRDGVINVDSGYIGSPDRFTFLDGLFPFLRSVRDHGYRLAVLTNQSGVARGMFSETGYRAVTSHMLATLHREGIDIDLTLACFAHPDGTVSPHTRESFWRKPNPGMVLEAIRRLDLNPACSAFIGDSERDMHAAQQGGIKHCLWLTDKIPTAQQGITLIRSFTEALQHLI